MQLTTKLAESNKAAVASAKQIEILEDHFTGLQTTSFEALELPQLEAKVAAKTGSSGIARAPLSETHTHSLSLSCSQTLSLSLSPLPSPLLFLL